LIRCGGSRNQPQMPCLFRVSPQPDWQNIPAKLCTHLIPPMTRKHARINFRIRNGRSFRRLFLCSPIRSELGRGFFAVVCLNFPRWKTTHSVRLVCSLAWQSATWSFRQVNDLSRRNPKPSRRSPEDKKKIPGARLSGPAVVCGPINIRMGGASDRAPRTRKREKNKEKRLKNC